MEQFETRYNMLNESQKQAVDTIDGPVFVIAGPGTGKTELLAVRVANILKKDPTLLPSNILCLTFTDAAASNMRSRLIRYIGQDAFQVAVHTFNSFGAYIMNAYPEYFFEWRDAETADELVVQRILEEILDSLPGHHPLTKKDSQNNYYSIRQLKNLISDAKKANVTPQELTQLLEKNIQDMSEILPLIREHLPTERMTPKLVSSFESLSNVLGELKDTQDTSPISLKNMLIQTLEDAVTTSANNEPKQKTKPLTKWKDEWLEKDADNNWLFKESKHTSKLIEASKVYEKYQELLKARNMADFNDQVLWVLQALEQHPELRLNLQEKFLYIMIDEYQDTNRAQLAMAQSLTDAAVHEGRPNILVVGDDDQAIYKFQGADITNIHSFETRYNNPVYITLTKNYRSNDEILGKSKIISSMIEMSLAKLKNINKQLEVTQQKSGSGASIEMFADEDAHYSWIAKDIKGRLEKGESGSEIAVLARSRDQLDALVPYLRMHNIPMDYERRENVLEQEHIVALITLARFIQSIADNNHDATNSLLPEILSHPMWNIEAFDIWKLSKRAYDNKTDWLEEIDLYEKDHPVKKVCGFLLAVAYQAKSLPLEQILDLLIGTQAKTLGESENDDMDTNSIQNPVNTNYQSPYKNYYFGKDIFNDKPEEYLQLLSHLSTLRRKLRSYQTSSTQTLMLGDLLAFIDAYNRAEIAMLDKSAHRENSQAVTLMTCHKSKGLEFETVYIAGTTNKAWAKNGGGNSRFSYPNNLKEIKPSDGDMDDELRLLFVAMTRAKQNLFVCYYLKDSDNKDFLPFAPLVESTLTVHDNTQMQADTTELIKHYQENWLSRHASVSYADKKALLSDKLENYALSATHFNNFLDISSGGPLHYLTQNLLNFPSSMSPSAVYGNIVHATLNRAHKEVSKGIAPDIAALIENFITELHKSGLDEKNIQYYSERGKNALEIFLSKFLPSFKASDKAEVSFDSQGAHIENAKLRGNIDLMEFNEEDKTIVVTDYKTGGSHKKWSLGDSAKEYEKIKLHRYKQQLLFYKLLVEGAMDFGQKGFVVNSANLTFVEPDESGTIDVLQYSYNQKDIERTKALIVAVWNKIMNLEFEDTSTYEPTLKGVIAFEDSLLPDELKSTSA